MLIDILSEILDSKGIEYVNVNGEIRFAVRSGSHRFESVFVEDDESFLRVYIKFPWLCPPEKREALLEKLNELNSKLRAGCFMTDNGNIIFRYGVYIFDEYTARESAEDLLITGFAAADAAWGEIFSVLAVG